MKRGQRTAHPGIIRVGPGEFVVRVTMRDPLSGIRKEKERRVTAETPQAALEEQVRMRRELESQASAPVINNGNPGETLGAFAKRWLLHMSATGQNRPHVVAQREKALSTFVLPVMGAMRLHEINAQVLLWWQAQLALMRKERGDVGKPYAQGTLHGAWSVFRAMLKDAVMLAGLKQDPTSGVKLEVRGAPAKQKDSLTRDEIVAVLKAARSESPDVRAMIWVGFTTGMRFCELCALRWAHVDFDGGAVLVSESHVRGHVGPTKTRVNRRPGLLPEVAEMLRTHRKWQIERQVPGLDKGLLFPSTTGTYRSPGMLTKPLQNCAEAAGVVKNITPHVFRHSVNNLVREAAGDVVARAIIGHSSAGMTEHYSHVSITEKLSGLRKALGDLTQALPSGGDGRWGSAVSGGDGRSVVRLVSGGSGEKT